MNHSVQHILDHKGRNVETVAATTTVLTAVKRMNECRIGSLVVVEDDRPIGIVTERDMLARVIEPCRDPETTPVSEVMTRELVVVRTETTVGEAMRLVSRRRCRHLPVMEAGRIVGLVSAGDLTAWVARARKQTIDDLHDYITR